MQIWQISVAEGLGYPSVCFILIFGKFVLYYLSARCVEAIVANKDGLGGLGEA